VSHSDYEEGFHLSFTNEPIKNHFDEYEEHTFSHYHFTEPNGTQSYSKLTGRKEYLSNEILSIAITSESNHAYAVNSLDRLTVLDLIVCQ